MPTLIETAPPAISNLKVLVVEDQAFQRNLLVGAQRYFDRRISMSAPESACMLRMAAVLAPLLSMVIFSGAPCRPMACSFAEQLGYVLP